MVLCHVFSNTTWFLAHNDPLEDNNYNGINRPTAVRSEVLGVPALGGDDGVRSSTGRSAWLTLGLSWSCWGWLRCCVNMASVLLRRACQVSPQSLFVSSSELLSVSLRRSWSFLWSVLWNGHLHDNESCNPFVGYNSPFNLSSFNIFVHHSFTIFSTKNFYIF